MFAAKAAPFIFKELMHLRMDADKPVADLACKTLGHLLETYEMRDKIRNLFHDN
jgi:hypothetical protein